MMRRLIAALFLLYLGSGPAWAANCSANPFTLVDGTTAFASQVMANFNNLLTCANTVLGKFTGPASAVNGNAVIFDGSTGQLGKDSGVALDNLAWTPYSPTIACGGGSPAANLQGAFKKIGKVVIIEGNALLTGGTCTINIVFSAPFSHVGGFTQGGVCSGNYIPSGGLPILTVVGIGVSLSNLNVFKYDGTFTGANVGDAWTWACVYQSV